MRIRPFIASVAMLSILSGVIRFAGGSWLDAVIALGVVAVFVFLMALAYRRMYEDDRD